MDKTFRKSRRGSHHEEELFIRVRSAQERFQAELDFKQNLSKLLKICKRLEDSGRIYAEEEKFFSLELQKLLANPVVERETFFDTSITQIANTVHAISDQRMKLMNKISKSIAEFSNISNFDTRELEGIKKKLERTKSDTEKAKSLEQSFDDRLSIEASLEGCAIDFENALDKFAEEREMKLLQYLEPLVNSQVAFFKTSSKLLSHITPTMEEISTYLQSTPSKVIKEGPLLIKSKMGSWIKCWVVLKEQSLFCYKENKPLRRTPSTVRTLTKCTVRNVFDNTGKGPRFEIITIELKKRPLTFKASTDEENEGWIKAIQESISNSINSMPNSSSSLSSVRSLLVNIQGNSVCADCGAPDPEWASINLGILICLECSGAHRSLGVQVSKVRSITLDKWEPEVIEYLQNIGNEKFNSIYEKVLKNKKPTPKSERDIRETFIKLKYVDKLFLESIQCVDLNLELYNTIIDSNNEFLTILNLLALGADINWSNPEENNQTPLMASIINDKVEYVQMLLLNGADIFKRESSQKWTSLHFLADYNAYNSAKLLVKYLRAMNIEDLIDNQGRSPLDLAKERHAFKIETIFNNYLNSIRSDSISPPPLMHSNSFGPSTSPINSPPTNSKNWSIKRKSGDVLKIMIQNKGWKKRTTTEESVPSDPDFPDFQTNSDQKRPTSPTLKELNMSSQEALSNSGRNSLGSSSQAQTSNNNNNTANNNDLNSILSNPKLKSLVPSSERNSGKFMPITLTKPLENMSALSSVSYLEITLTDILKFRSQLIPDTLKPIIPLPIRLVTFLDWKSVANYCIQIFAHYIQNLTFNIEEEKTVISTAKLTSQLLRDLEDFFASKGLAPIDDNTPTLSPEESKLHRLSKLLLSSLNKVLEEMNVINQKINDITDNDLPQIQIFSAKIIEIFIQFFTSSNL